MNAGPPPPGLTQAGEAQAPAQPRSTHDGDKGRRDNKPAALGPGPRETAADPSARSGRNSSEELRFAVKPEPDSDGQRRCSSEGGTWPRTSAVTDPRAALSADGPRVSMKLCGPDGCFLNKSRGMVAVASTAGRQDTAVSERCGRSRPSRTARGSGGSQTDS